MYYLPFRDLMVFWNRAQNGGRKSFRFEELKDEYFIKQGSEVFVPYLEAIQIDLQNR